MGENMNMLETVLTAFKLTNENSTVDTNYGSGHINDTIKVEAQTAEGKSAFIIQRVNTNVFKRPHEMMDNILKITDYMRAHSDDEQYRQGVLNFCATRDGHYLFQDDQGGYWRCYRFVDNAITYQVSESADTFRLSGVAFGQFMANLRDFPAEQLVETIPDFHDTRKRFEYFKSVLAADKFNRAQECQPEIQFLLQRAEQTGLLTDALAQGKLPLRVTHNDTKLNNVLFSVETGEPLAVIDLDTVMPGLAAYDFGDSIRFGASTALEDEPDLSKVHFSMELFKAYADGYLSVCASSISAEEVQSLALGARLITLETGLRFLTDFLAGDTYFKIHRAGHNLDRARTQFKLVAEMENVYDEMLRVLRDYSVKYGGIDFPIPA